MLKLHSFVEHIEIITILALNLKLYTMSNTRKLTIEEQKRVLESAKWMQEFTFNFDFNQDASLRLTCNGYDYYTHVNINTLHEIEIKKDAHVCNIIGNMNYTNAYNKINN